MSDAITARVLRGPAAVDDIAARAPLAARAPASIIGSPAWVRSAHEHLHAGDAACIVAERAGVAVGRLSLAIDDGEAGPVARMAGHPMNDLTDVQTRPGDEDAAGSAVLQALHDLASGGIAVDLGDLDPDGTLAAAARRDAPAALSGGDPAPILDLGAQVPLGSSSRRKEWRRQQRRLRDGHAVEVVWQRETAPEALDDLLALRAARFEAAGRAHELPSIERDSTFTAFLTAAIARLAAERRCAIASLLVDGRAIGRDLYLLDGEVAMLFLRGFDPAWATRAPGHLLLQACAEELRAEGVRVLDLGRGDEPYKADFGARPRTLARLRLAACGSSRP